MITASLVLYNTPVHQIKGVVDSLVNCGAIDLLYVINNSPDIDYSAFFKDCKAVDYIEHNNTGYGSSHNIALKKAIQSGSTYHIILNPDILFESNVISALADYMDQNPDAVSIMPKVTYRDGSIQYLCKLLPEPVFMFGRRFLGNLPLVARKNNKYILLNSGYDKIMNPPCLSGCFMFLRVDTLKQHNIAFDDRFFMYFEDFDLIRTLHRYGRTVYYPAVSIIHDHARESYHSKKMLKIHIKSAVMYFNKYGWLFDKERRQMNKQILREIKQFNK